MATTSVLSSFSASEADSPIIADQSSLKEHADSSCSGQKRLFFPGVFWQPIQKYIVQFKTYDIPCYIINNTLKPTLCISTSHHITSHHTHSAHVLIWGN